MDRNKTRKHGELPELPEELVECQILARLPIISLVRLKVVCSKWRDTIECPHFAKLRQQFSHSNNPDMVLLRQDHPDGSSDFFAGGIKVRPPMAGKHFHVFSSNGVLLLVDYTNREMRLWNPTTGKSRYIPKPPDFESEPGPVSCEFRFDPNSGGFIIFTVIKHHDPECDSNTVFTPFSTVYSRYSVRVLSSDSETWKTVEIPLLSRSRIHAKAFIHGGFHFFGEDCIMRLSPAGKIMARFRPPPGYRFRSSTHFFRTDLWNGRLCLKGSSENTTASGGIYEEVWVMEEYGDDRSWKLVWSLPFVSPFSVTLDLPKREELGFSHVCLVSEPDSVQEPRKLPLSQLIQNSLLDVHVLRDARDLADCNTMVRILTPQEVSQIPYPLEMPHMLCLHTYTKTLFDPNASLFS